MFSETFHLVLIFVQMEVLLYVLQQLAATHEKNQALVFFFHGLLQLAIDLRLLSIHIHNIQYSTTEMIHLVNTNILYSYD